MQDSAKVLQVSAEIWLWFHLIIMSMPVCQANHGARLSAVPLRALFSQLSCYHPYHHSGSRLVLRSLQCCESADACEWALLKMREGLHALHYSSLLCKTSAIDLLTNTITSEPSSIFV